MIAFLPVSWNVRIIRGFESTWVIRIRSVREVITKISEVDLVGKDGAKEEGKGGPRVASHTTT